MSTMLQLITDLHPIRAGVCGDGADQLVARMCEELPFTVHEFACGLEHNGWIIPWKWDCQSATVRDADGRLVYDGNAHPLGVACFSESFTGQVTGEVLKKHAFFCAYPGYEDALIYHCDYLYKMHTRDWAFSMPKRVRDSLDDNAEYHVDLRTTYTHGTMKVPEYVLPGDSEESIILNGHTCHNGMSNDDLSGCAVGIEVIRRLAKLPSRRYTYRLIPAPEHFGSIFYLQRFGSKNLRFALFLESLGSTGKLALQESFTGESMIDLAIKNVLQGTKHYVAKFRTIAGNDETCWEGAGHDVPCPSLSRVPFEQYHTSKDNPSIMSEESLNEAVEVVYQSLMALERNATINRLTTGLVCLSNPKYDLYKPFWDPSIPDRRSITDEAANWNHLMNMLPRFFDGGHTIIELAQRFHVSFQSLYDYLIEWQRKGLVRLVPAGQSSDAPLLVLSGTCS